VIRLSAAKEPFSLLALVAVTAVATGCGGAAKPQAGSSSAEAAPTVTPSRQATAAPPPLEECRSAGQGWQPLPTPGDYRPPAAGLGSGRLGVVFVNDSDNDACAWSREARALAEHGYAVAVFETVGAYEAAEVGSVAAALRRAGARRIALIGASVGARAVLQVAAERLRALVGVVALSAERKLPPNPSDLLPIGRQIQVPVLSVGSRHDPLTSFGKDTLAWDRTIPDDRALILSGGDHGVDFLTDRHRRRVRAAILAFLRSL
jgi:pimeloyl-ACP methyl ester carboxylesterase